MLKHKLIRRSDSSMSPKRHLKDKNIQRPYVQQISVNVMDAIVIPILVFQNNTITYVNNAFRYIMKYQLQDVINKNVYYFNPKHASYTIQNSNLQKYNEVHEAMERMVNCEFRQVNMISADEIVYECVLSIMHEYETCVVNVLSCVPI